MSSAARATSLGSIGARSRPSVTVTAIPRRAAFHSAAAAVRASSLWSHSSRNRGKVRSFDRRPPPYQTGLMPFARSAGVGVVATE